MYKKFLPLAALAVLSALSCTQSERSLIEKTLSDREQSFETNDVELYLSSISPDYSAKKGKRTFGIKELKLNFEGISQFFDHIKITHSNRSIYYYGDKAKVVQRALVEVRMEKENIHTSFMMKETIELKKTGEKWLIIKEADRDYAEGFVYGGGG